MKKAELLRLARLVLPQVDDESMKSEGMFQSDVEATSLCSLWAGTGHILMVSCRGKRFIVKQIRLSSKNPKASVGDRRKAASYEVEANFYERLAVNLIDEHGLRVPRPYHVERKKNEILLCLSYVHSNGHHSLEETSKAVLTWLATLHAATWGEERANRLVNDNGLQETGSYWHLNTRPEEHASMPDKGWEGRLKLAARAIDERLKRDPLQCVIHGDAKDANVLWSADDDDGVVLCDYQYTGKGPPSKDLAYFFCSSCDNLDGEEEEAVLLKFYLDRLSERLKAPPPTMQQLKESLYLAYCDFHRFMSGWGHWGSGAAEKRAKSVLYRLDGGKKLPSEQAYDEAVRREFG
jgi:hypothetical protein